MKNKTALSLAAIFLSLVLFPSVASANNSIIAIPPRLDLLTDPGKTVTATLKIHNDFDIQELFTIDVQDFVVIDNIGTPIPVNASNNRWALRKWITAPDVIPVDAHATQTLSISIKVPMNALPGGHYAMITYQPHGDINPGELKSTGNLIAQRVGTLIYLQVSGAINEKASVIQFKIPKFQEQGPVEIAGLVENNSDIHVNPQGSITIFNPLNTKVAELPLEIGNIFPEASRGFTTNWNQKWGWGRYRADLNLAYGNTGGLIAATVFFWLFPIRLVIYSLIGIISILAILILLGKRNKKHQEFLEHEVEQLKREIEEIEKP